jgi:hypothetical protein
MSYYPMNLLFKNNIITIFLFVVISFNKFELLRASGGTLILWFRLHLLSLAPTNPHWPSVAIYGHSPYG